MKRRNSRLAWATLCSHALLIVAYHVLWIYAIIKRWDDATGGERFFLALLPLHASAVRDVGL